MVVLVTFKNEEDPIKNGGTRVLTRLMLIFQTHKGSNSTVRGGIWLKFELIQAFMVTLVNLNACNRNPTPLLSRIRQDKVLGAFKLFILLYFIHKLT